jgi:hypothetical protein
MSFHPPCPSCTEHASWGSFPLKRRLWLFTTINHDRVFLIHTYNMWILVVVGDGGVNSLNCNICPAQALDSWRYKSDKACCPCWPRIVVIAFIPWPWTFVVMLHGQPHPKGGGPCEGVGLIGYRVIVVRATLSILICLFHESRPKENKPQPQPMLLTFSHAPSNWWRERLIVHERTSHPTLKASKSYATPMLLLEVDLTLELALKTIY